MHKVCVSRSPAVECCANVATRNEGLELNLDGKRKRRMGVIREHCRDWREGGNLPLSKMKTVVNRKCNLMMTQVIKGHWQSAGQDVEQSQRKCEKANRLRKEEETGGWRPEKRKRIPMEATYEAVFSLQIHWFLQLPPYSICRVGSINARRKKLWMQCIKSHIH